MFGGNSGEKGENSKIQYLKEVIEKTGTPDRKKLEHFYG
jgi:hypothetical protein